MLLSPFFLLGKGKLSLSNFDCPNVILAIPRRVVTRGTRRIARSFVFMKNALFHVSICRRVNLDEDISGKTERMLVGRADGRGVAQKEVHIDSFVVLNGNGEA